MLKVFIGGALIGLVAPPVLRALQSSFPDQQLGPVAGAAIAAGVAGILIHAVVG